MATLAVDPRWEDVPTYRDVRAALRLVGSQLLDLLDASHEYLDRAELDDAVTTAFALREAADDYAALLAALAERVASPPWFPDDPNGPRVKCVTCDRTWPAGTDDWGTVHHCKGREAWALASGTSAPPPPPADADGEVWP